MKTRLLFFVPFSLAVVLAAGATLLAAPVLQNGSFEAPELSGTAHQAQPEGAVWTFGSPRSGIDRGNPYGSPPNCTPLTGAQMAYLQGDFGAGGGISYVEQQLSGLVAGLTYSIGYNAKAIEGFSGVNPFKISVDGMDAVADWIVPPTAFEAGTVEFTAASDTAVLRFYDAGNVASGKVTWLDDITVNVVAPERPELIVNGGFETPAYPDVPSHVKLPSETGWDFGGTLTGIDRGNPYGVANSGPYDGVQLAFIQGSGTGTSSIGQTVSGLEIGEEYVLTFAAKAIDGFSGVNPLTASVGGTALMFDGSTTISPSTEFAEYSAVFTATSESTTVQFADAGNVPVLQVTWIDGVSLVPVVPETGTNLVMNSSFEKTQYVEGSHNANVDGDYWRFTLSPASATAGSGIDNNCTYGSIANATPFDGDQWGFIQGAGDADTVMSIEQDVFGFEPGKQYVVSFEAKAIGGFDGVNPFSVSLGETDLEFNGDIVVDPELDWGFFSSQVVTATDETMTLRFYDAGGVPSTQVSWIDAVSVVEVPEPGCLVLLLGGVAAVLWRQKRN